MYYDTSQDVDMRFCLPKNVTKVLAYMSEHGF